MSVHQATDDFGILSIDGTVMGGSRLVASERVPVCQDRSRGVSREAPIPRVDPARMPAKAERPMTRVRVIEVLDGQPKTLLGDYYFAQLPIINDKITVANRRGWYDIMKVLYLVHAPEVTAYVRWIRMKIFKNLAKK